MAAHASESRKTASAATSCGSAMRPDGVAAITDSTIRGASRRGGAAGRGGVCGGRGGGVEAVARALGRAVARAAAPPGDGEVRADIADRPPARAHHVPARALRAEE